MFIIPFSSLSEQEMAALAGDKLQTAKEEWEQLIWRFIVDWYDNNTTSIEVYTSGSTGKPKAIQHTKQVMAAHARLTCETLQLPPCVTAWLCLPAHKIGGMMMLVRSLVNRMDLLCTKPSGSPFSVLEEKHPVVFAALTPMQLKSAINDAELFRKMNCIQTILLGGETVSAELLQHLQRAENNIYSTFGMTETISHIALKKISGTNPNEHYHTLKGITVSTDERNCLTINAPAFGVHHLVTNDMVEILSPTAFNWLGRIDNIINTGGIKVIPEQVEQKLLPFIDAPFFIVGIPDEKTGERVALVVEKETLDNDEKTSLQNCFSVLGKYEVPRTILHTAKFERADNGKVKRKETMQRFQT